MKYIRQYSVLIFLFAIIGCSPNTEQMNVEQADMNHAPQQEQLQDETIVRKLIKEGQVEFETSSLSATRKTIFETVQKYNAYISLDQEYKSTGRKSNTMIVRVPSDKFDSLLNDATRGVEKFDSKEIQVKDVTEEFLDVQARLKTKKELESRYLVLLKQAKTVTEVLEIEKELGQLRSEIESVEGRLKYLEDRVSISTLTITFYERIANETRFAQEFKNGLKNGWDNLIWFFVALVNIWPFVIIILLLFAALLVYRRKKKNKA